MPPTPRNGGPVRKAQTAPSTTLPLGAPVDDSATADVATGALDAVTGSSSATIAIGAELLCEPFETGAAVLGTVASIDGESVELTLADLGSTWPVGLDRIDVDAGTWKHVADDYPAVGDKPLFDAARRPWLAVAAHVVVPVADVVALAKTGASELKEAASQFAKLADLVAPLVGVDGAPVGVPLATTAPALAEPEQITKAAPPVVPAGHPGDGWLLCRVAGLGNVSGDWIRQSDGRHSGIARHGDVGFFTCATVTKFERNGQADLLTRL